MVEYHSWRGYSHILETLSGRLREPAPGLIQILVGPRQVGKTTLLLELNEGLRDRSIYGAVDSPEASTPGWWDAIWNRAEDLARREGMASLLLDEIHALPEWSGKLKGQWDRLKRKKIPLHVVVTGSSSLRVGSGSRESLAGRFERNVLTHWPAAEISRVFGIDPEVAAWLHVQRGSYPGAMALLEDDRRWRTYVRESIMEPAVGRDILLLQVVRKPGLLRQVFSLSTQMPAEIVSLQKIQATLQDRGALETIAHYLDLLGEAFLIRALEKFSPRPVRRRSAPPKIIVLSNGLLAAAGDLGVPDPKGDPSRWGRWVENACLAFAVNSAQTVRYWRKEPHEVDAILDGDWGKWAVEVKTGRFRPAELAGLLLFSRDHPPYRPLVLCDPDSIDVARAAGADAQSWTSFLLEGPASRPS